MPAWCEQPECKEEIDRGMSYACGGEPFSEFGCDRYFCGKHLSMTIVDNTQEDLKCRHGEEDCDCEWIDLCERCAKGEDPFPYKPERPIWVKHLLTDESWAEWRKNNPKEVKALSNGTK